MFEDLENGNAPKQQPARRPNGGGESTGLMAFGMLLTAIGLCVIVFFFVAYDPTMPLHPAVDGVDGYVSPRVVNDLRMQNRQLGIILGAASAVIGTIMMVAGRSRN